MKGYLKEDDLILNREIIISIIINFDIIYDLSSELIEGSLFPKIENIFMQKDEDFKNISCNNSILGQLFLYCEEKEKNYGTIHNKIIDLIINYIEVRQYEIFLSKSF